MPVEPPPFLGADERVEYLYRREYFEPGSISEAHRERLSQINFHYFLGYARNYRMLVGHGAVDTPKVPGQVFSLMDKDHEVSELLYRGVRRAEWILRGKAVELYCKKYPSVGSFLRSTQFVTTSEAENGDDLVSDIISQTLRYGEPYVKEHVDSKFKDLGLPSRPKRYDRTDHDKLVAVIEDLPIWSIVDGFSFGLLAKFIERCDNSSGDEVWRSIAQSLGIPAGIFQTNLRSVVVLRNQISHHNRIWMRPTTDSPRPPKMFKKALRGVDNKSAMVGFYNLALFQGGASEAREFVGLIEVCVGNAGPYRHGLVHVGVK